MSFVEGLLLMEIGIRHAGGYVGMFEPGVISCPSGTIRGHPFFSLFFYFILF